MTSCLPDPIDLRRDRYCAGDFVLTIKETDGVWGWAKVAWGGKGDKPGQFKTAHGVFAHEGHIFVANREAHQVVKFSPSGDLVRVLPGIPAGSRICNISYAEKNDYLLLNPLAKVTEDQVSIEDRRAGRAGGGALRVAGLAGGGH